MTPFKYPLLKSIMPLKAPANPVVVNQATPPMEMLTKKSNSIIRITNNDELCCARALVTAKAKVDQHPKEKAIRQGKLCKKKWLSCSITKPRCPSVHAVTTPWRLSVKPHPSPVTKSSWWMRIDRSTSRPLDPFKTNNSSCCTTKTIMTSLPACLGFSGPVMSVLIVGNPMTMKDCIDATRKSCAEPVGRKTAPISCMPTPDTSKPLNVASRVIGTFLETRVSKPMSWQEPRWQTRHRLPVLRVLSTTPMSYLLSTKSRLVQHWTSPL